MRYRIISSLTAAVLTCGTCGTASAYAGETDAPVLKDSGISYTETVETISNPGAGYTTTIWPVCKPGSTPTYSPTGSLVLFFVDIGGFSSGANGTENEDGTYTPGTDYDLDETFFTAWRTTFENCRKNGCMVALRFRYDALGQADPEPATFEQVLKHISQIKESGILEDYKDILCFVESGFVGKWGEQHGGKYVTVDYKAKLLDAMLDCVPSPVPVTVRTPDIFAEWAGIKRSELGDYVLEEGSRASRVGLYDDGYMGSNSDLGTYSDREKETSWLGRQTLTAYFGGEFSGNIDFAKQYDTYLPENAIPEMYKTHLSYINANIFQLYKDYTFGADCDVEGADNSAYYGQNVFQFIRDHIGYRFVLRKSELTPETTQGGSVDLHFRVENTGFANPIPKQSSYFLLEKDGVYYRCDGGLDTNKWYSCTTADAKVTLELPGSIPAGEWNVYLKITEGMNDVSQLGMRSVRFANSGVWNASLGADLLGTVKVTEAESHSFRNSFNVSGLPENEGYAHTVRGQVITDGTVSSHTEWADDMLIAENNGSTVSMTADEEYLYVMGHLPDSASAPVYNLRLTRADGESYWIYFQSNGFVYFNHGSHEGAVCKWQGDTVEFKIPLDLMGLKGRTELQSVRLFLQDSANEWNVLGDVSSAECKVPGNFKVYTAENYIRLKRGASYTMAVETLIDGAGFQWFKDGEPIIGAQSSTYTIESADAETVGEYSVKAVSSEEIEKTVEICSVLEVGGSIVWGDADGDSEVKMNDVVLVMQSIADQDKYGLNGTDNDHITEQGQINANVYDNANGIITVNDALQIQRYLLELIDTLDPTLT